MSKLFVQPKLAHPLAFHTHNFKRWLVGASAPRYGYDGINADAEYISTHFPHASFVAGYDTGGWPWSAQAWALFPHAERIHIVTRADANEGDVLDVENGDASPGQVEGWIALRKKAGYYRPTIYCNGSTVPSVRAGSGKYVLNVDYDLWVADWTGHPFQFVCSDGKRAAVTQYWSQSEADYDVAYDANWPHRGAAPKPKPVPVPPPIPTPVFTGYKNPLRSVKNLIAQRIDQGVDYAGSGPLYSLGNGVVVNVFNSGWPGGTFICVKLSDGPFAGHLFYYAENITPSVRSGQRVTTDTILGILHDSSPNCELGWAAPPGSGESLARANGQVAPSGDPGDVSSAYGKNFSDLLHSLGAPSGVLQGKVVGQLPANWPSFRPPPSPGPKPVPVPAPPPAPVPAARRIVATGTVSLYSAAVFYKTSEISIIVATFKNGTTAERQALLFYLESSPGKTGKLPKGLVYYVPKGS